MLNKIKRFLLRQKNVTFLRKSEGSESLYFQVGDHIVRVSDHIPTSQCRPEQLNILTVTNSESFTILLNNRIAILPNYSRLKEYIKFYVLSVGTLGGTVHSTVKVVKEVIKEVETPVYKEVEGLSFDEKDILDNFRRISPRQRIYFINQFRMSVVSKEARKYRSNNHIK